MKALVILGVIVLALVLLSFVRLGALVEYGEHGLSVRVKTGPFKLTVYPRKPKKNETDTSKPPKKKQSAAQQKRSSAPKGGPLAMVKKFLPLIAEAAGRFKRKIRIDVFHLDFTAAASDPAKAAMAFGGANAVIGMLWPLIEQNFQVKERRLRTAVDFNATAPSVSIFAQATLTLGQAITLGLRLTIRFLKLFMEYRTQTKQTEKQTSSTQKEAV